MLFKRAELIKAFVSIAGSALVLSSFFSCNSINSPSSVTPDRPTKIIGGAEVTGNDQGARSTAALYNIQTEILCTATVLSDRVLLTAAHCLAHTDPNDWRVMFGADLGDQGASVVQLVIDFAVSDSWPSRQNESKDRGDLALVSFAGGLPATLTPARLLSPAQEGQLISGQTLVQLIGYGSTNGVDDSGSGILRSVTTTVQKLDFSSTEVLLDQSHAKGACHGDSGAPGDIEVNGQFFVFGIVSRGIGDAKQDCSVSVALTKVSAYQKWIQDTSARLWAAVQD